MEKRKDQIKNQINIPNQGRQDRERSYGGSRSGNALDGGDGDGGGEFSGFSGGDSGGNRLPTRGGFRRMGRRGRGSGRGDGGYQPYI
jgi:hypothetical protein